MNVSLHRLSGKTIQTMGITVKIPSHSHVGRVFPRPLGAADDATDGHQSQFTDMELGLA